MAGRSAGMAAYRLRGGKTARVLENPDTPDRPPKPRYANIRGGDIARDVIGTILFLLFGWLLVEFGQAYGSKAFVFAGWAYIAVGAASPLLTFFWSRYPELTSVPHAIARTPGSAVSVIKWAFLGWLLWTLWT